MMEYSLEGTPEKTSDRVEGSSSNNCNSGSSTHTSIGSKGDKAPDSITNSDVQKNKEWTGSHHFEKSRRKRDKSR